MQALTRTLFPCYAEADRATAERIAAFVERGANVRIFLDDGAIPAGGDLLEKAREARTADLVLVLFSRHSMPPRWSRADWEPALVTEPADEGVRIAFVKCDERVPPAVLKPAFEASRLRDIKRWARGVEAQSPAPSPENAADLEVLGIAIADRSGGVETVASAAIAEEFARVFAADFDAVIRVETGERRLAAIVGEVAWKLGLKLAGNLPENLDRLRAFCESRRLLFIHQGGEVPELFFEGNTSTLVCQEVSEPSRDPLAEIHRVFAVSDDWSALCQSARQARRIARDLDRIAELYDVMEAWSAMAAAREDRVAREEAMRELVWILEGWGKPDEALHVERERAMNFDEQMLLF